ncbi:MAG: TRAP transporter small permease [Burkholderiales bacterium]|nr:TRAP transporter small permease [Burkholderiales bacterium]
MKPLLDRIHRLLTWLLAFAVAILIVPVSIQIFSRFTQLIPAYIWTEEMSRFFFIWMVMLGAMVGLRERLHFDVDVWPALPPRRDAVLRMVANAFVLVFIGVMIAWGVEFTRFGWNQTSELADLPMWLIFIAWPVAGVIWLLFLVEAFVRDVGLYRRGEPLDGTAPEEAL